MQTNKLLIKAQKGDFLNFEEAIFLYKNASTSELMMLANEIRFQKHPEKEVSWIIDRNVNITNVCISRCKFCNFHCTPKSENAYITSIDEYKKKIEETLELGGNQLLLQGGLHPDLDVEYYSDLFKQLKQLYPDVKLHALGPPEIAHLSKLDKVSYREVLVQLVEAGLDSLPGAGAEILCDEIRKQISPAKATTKEWFDVMREAHKLNLPTSATMMFGHIESKEDRIKHILSIRDVQEEKPKDAYGFIAFIPWPFQDENTVLRNKDGVINKVSADEYIRTIAISRILLPNVDNIQASWLTIGIEIGQICLHAGANDLGSIMIEENVVSSAGASFRLDGEGMKRTISEAGFTPKLRNQKYEMI